ncbi:MAG: aspartyl protease family protein [Acidobacteriota bacterium]
MPILIARQKTALVLAIWLCAPAGLPADEAHPQDPASTTDTSRKATGEQAARETAIAVISKNVRVLAATGASRRAISELQRLLERAPDAPESHLLAVKIYFQFGQDDTAAFHARQASALDPESPEPHRWLARLARWGGRMEEARRHLKRAVERRPQSTDLLTELAMLYEATGHRWRAQRFYRRAARQDPDDADAALEAALSVRDPRLRDRTLQQLVRRFPDHSLGRAWANLSASVAGQPFWEIEPVAFPVEVPIQIERRQFFVVRAEINGHKRVRLLLDTGSSGLKLTRAAAESLELDIFGSLRVGGLGARSVISADLALLDSLRLGSLVLHRIPVTLLDSLPLGDGLLNPKALKSEAVRFDVSSRRLILGNSRDLMPEGSQPLRFHAVDEHPLVQLYLNGRPRLAMIDTGSGATIFDPSLVRQIPQRRRMLLTGMEFHLSGITGKVKDARPIHVARLSIAGLVVENPFLFEADLSLLSTHLGTDIQILFGADLLSRFDATFDYRMMELVLEPAQRGRRRLRPGY